MQKIWKKKTGNPRVSEFVEKKYKKEKYISDIISTRIKTIFDSERYVNPEIVSMHNPYLMKDMEKAVKIIMENIESKKILIYGDYDTDGTTATAVMYKTLRTLTKNDIYYFIPNRFEHGYGLNKNMIQEFFDGGIEMIITVDCGITDVEEVQFAKDLGMIVIVTDHHEPQEKLPSADAIINPKLGYPFKNLAGVGVALKLSQALRHSYCLDLMDLVAIGTVADMMELVDENRIIVSYGLNNIKTPALKTIVDILNIKNTNTYDVGFKIVPRINAMGRLTNDVSVLVDMFLSEDISFIEKTCEKLSQKNTERQGIQENIYSQVERKIKEYSIEDTYFFIVDGDEWSKGVVGLVANDVVKKFNRPALILNKVYADTYSGSGRSTQHFNLFESLMEHKQLFKEIGGHSHAVGFSIDKDNVPKLRKIMNEHYKTVTDPIYFIPSVNYDIELNEINRGIVESIKCLEPFGMGNTAPLFRINNIEVLKRELLKDKYLKFSCVKNGIYFSVIIWDSIGLVYNEILPNTIDLVGAVSIDKMDNISVIAEDIKMGSELERKITKDMVYQVFKQIKEKEKVELQDLIGFCYNIKEYLMFILVILQELNHIIKIGDVYYYNKSDKKLEDSQVLRGLV